VGYRAELTDLVRAHDALVRLLTENLSVAGDLGARLRWLYADGPAGPGEVFLLRCDDEPVGCAGIAVRQLWVGDRPLRAALLADFVVERKHRSGMPAILMQRAVKRHVAAAFDLTYSFPNDRAVAVVRRLGYQELGKMDRYARVLRHGAYLEDRYGRPLATRMAGALIDRAKHAVRVARTLRPARSLELEWRADVDPRFDRLADAMHGYFRIACRRDAAMLRWRFLQDARRPVIAALVAKDSRELRAYAMVRGARGGLAEIVDLLGDLDALGDLLVLLVPALYRRGHTAVSFRFLGDPRVAALLEAHHFSRRDPNRVVIVDAGLATPDEAAVIRDPRAWYLTDFDEDV